MPAPTDTLSQLAHRWYLWRMTHASGAKGFVSQPEPRTIGSFAKGRQLIAGNFLFAGYLVESRDREIWDLPIPDRSFEEELHGFMWLDDLAAVGDLPARKRAQSWTQSWIAKYASGQGPGWTPDLTGRRLIRWINHALFLLNGGDKSASDAYFLSIGKQVVYLSRRWKTASSGLPRFEALTGLIYAGLALQGMENLIEPALKALSQDCRTEIDPQGGIPTRNPEDLLEVFTLLTWSAAALTEAGRTPSPDHVAAIERIAPALRALRHADGSLARFHGGGRGIDGRLDHALANSGIRAHHTKGLSMGYARLPAGRTSVIVDASAPPSGKASFNAHASTLAFELTSGRRPLIVNCGSGVAFGPSWRRAGRATPSHSTLGIEGVSSSRLGKAAVIAGRERELLSDHPQNVTCRQNQNSMGFNLYCTHDGYRKTHGLIHARKLDLSAGGRSLEGEDTLAAVEQADQRRFDLMMDRSNLQGIPYSIRFHLHPDVDATVDLGGNAVSMALKSGEIWVLRHDGFADLSLEPSVFLERNRLKPRATKQVVLSARILEYSSRISWSLAKAQDTPTALRDLETADLMAR